MSTNTNGNTKANTNANTKANKNVKQEAKINQITKANKFWEDQRESN